MKSCLRKTRTAFAVIKAVISRSIFALHGFICIWRVTVVKGNPNYWWLASTLLFLLAETFLTIIVKKGGEWKWVCPSVLLYLVSAVPAIWFLELDLMEARILTSRSASSVLMLPTLNVSQDDAISSVLNKQLLRSISLGREEWCKILEQMLLLILIIGRWLLPKGQITREQLSQLLLVYIGMAADIIELFEAFKEDGVRENLTLTLVILGLWSASLTQFTFVLTATKAKRMRAALVHSGSTSSAASARLDLACCPGGKACVPTEVVSIMISMLLQDAPFLILRLLLIFRHDVLSYTNIFFTAKNSLVLVLQFYRLLVLFNQKKKDEKTALKSSKQVSYSTNDSEDAESMGRRSCSAGVGLGNQCRHLTCTYGAHAGRKIRRDRGMDLSSSASDIVALSMQDEDDEDDDESCLTQGDGDNTSKGRGHQNQPLHYHRQEYARREKNSPAAKRRTSFVQQRAVEEGEKYNFAETVTKKDEGKEENEEEAEIDNAVREPLDNSVVQRRRQTLPKERCRKNRRTATTASSSSSNSTHQSPPRSPRGMQPKPKPADRSCSSGGRSVKTADSKTLSEDGSIWVVDMNEMNEKLPQKKPRRALEKKAKKSPLAKPRSQASDLKESGRGNSCSSSKERTRDKGQGKRSEGQDHWQDVQSLAKALTFLNETGGYKTLVLRPLETRDQQTVFVVESDPEKLCDIEFL